MNSELNAIKSVYDYIFFIIVLDTMLRPKVSHLLDRPLHQQRVCLFNFSFIIFFIKFIFSNTNSKVSLQYDAYHISIP